MKAISYTAARENLAATMNKVCEDRDPVIITRKRDQAVVMLRLEEFIQNIGDLTPIALRRVRQRLPD